MHFWLILFLPYLNICICSQNVTGWKIRVKHKVCLFCDWYQWITWQNSSNSLDLKFWTFRVDFLTSFLTKNVQMLWLRKTWMPRSRSYLKLGSACCMSILSETRVQAKVAIFFSVLQVHVKLGIRLGIPITQNFSKFGIEIA